MSEITVDAVKKLNMAELKSELSKRGLSVNGKKEELLKRLTEAIREIHSESIDNNKLNEPDTPLNKENLTGLIKEILKEEFAKQEKNISNLINGNFEITMKEIRKSQDEIKDLRKEITEFKESLEFTGNELHGKIKKLEGKNESIKKAVDKIYNSQVDFNFAYDKLIDLEDRSRRNNLRISGISESKYETWEKCEEKVDEVFREKLGLDNIHIERAHRVKRGKNDKSTKPRTIVCNLLSFKEKKLVMKNAKKLKNTNIFIDEDFSPETMEYRKQLWEEVKELRRKGNIAYLNYRSVVNKGMKRDNSNNSVE